MTPIRSPRARAGQGAAAPTTYGLRIPAHIEGRMRRCRASVRTAIQRHLGEIAASAGSQRRRAKSPDHREPPLRFYVYEGYRIAYQLDADARHVVVLNLDLLPAV